MSATIAGGLGEWVSGLGDEDVPDAVRRHVRTALLDTLGCALYGSTLPWSRIAADSAAALGAGGPSPVWGSSICTSAGNAALANGVAAHGFEMDDAHLTSFLHPGAVTVPAVLALAPSAGVTGAALVTAVLAGYEVGIRVGIRGGSAHALRGFHATGTAGCIAAAAGAAKTLGLDAERTTSAIALATTQAAGLYSARKGSMAKRLHAGHAAHVGVWSAVLAGRGFTGHPEVFEMPDGGFFAATGASGDPDAVLTGLGSAWETAEVGFKVYASCASTHTTVDALDQLMRQGLRAEDVERLEIAMTEVPARNVGWRYVPTDVMGAQMNGSYAAAVKLLDGAVFVEQFAAERLADPEVRALADRVHVTHDPDLDAGGPPLRHAVRVTAVRRDGTTVRAAVDHRRGGPQNPVTAAEVEQKFRRLATPVLGAERAERLRAAVLGADDADSREVAQLIDLLGAP